MTPLNSTNPISQSTFSMIGPGSGNSCRRSATTSIPMMSLARHWVDSPTPRAEKVGKSFSHARVPRIVKVYLEAYGCTQNYGEARLMQQALVSRGHGIAPTPAEADANVIVTCTVIETTERKMFRRMQALAAEGKPL